MTDDFLVDPEGASPADDDSLAVSDEMLLMGVRLRDQAALASLYDRHGGLLFTLALRVVGEHAPAEQAVHDALIRCWHGQERYESTQGTVSAWLLRVTRRCAISLLRQPPPRDRVEDARSPREVELLAPSAPETPEAISLRQSIAEALAELPMPQRTAIELAYYAGLSQTETAARLGESHRSVETQLRDGLTHLRHRLASASDSSMDAHR